MSLLGQVQAKPGRGFALWTSTPSGLGGVVVVGVKMMMMVLHANIHLRLLIHRRDCTARRSFPNKKKYSPENLKQHALPSALSVA